VGDSPLIGAGTWANADTCAISATGAGEAFIVASFAHEVHARMRHAGEPLEAAAQAALQDVLGAGGRGGAICVGADGSFSMPATDEVFQRGWLVGDEPPECRLDADC
jgi:beta-aspartyl-peptidase (threonine type)